MGGAEDPTFCGAYGQWMGSAPPADIAWAVGDQIEALLHAGVRLGGDVVKALALSTRAINRAGLPMGLSVNGQAGVEIVPDPDILRHRCLPGRAGSRQARLDPLAVTRGLGHTTGLHPAGWRLTANRPGLFMLA